MIEKHIANVIDDEWALQDKRVRVNILNVLLVYGLRQVCTELVSLPHQRFPTNGALLTTERNMHRNLFVLLTLFSSLLTAGAALGQDESSDVVNDSAALSQARVLLKFGREDIVKEEMRFSEAEADAFWPVYDRYEADLLAVRDRYAELVTGYTAAYRAGTVSEAQAEQIVEGLPGDSGTAATNKTKIP